VKIGDYQFKRSLNSIIVDSKYVRDSNIASGILVAIKKKEVLTSNQGHFKAILELIKLI